LKKCHIYKNGKDNKKKHLKLNIRFNFKLISLIIIFLAIPLTVGLVLVSQEIRSRAEESSTVFEIAQANQSIAKLIILKMV
jgi:hypothetical protein